MVVQITFYNPTFDELIEDHELSVLISEPTCFKRISPTCIDNFLTSKMNTFHEYSNTGNRCIR